jgi:hypothetical protein
MEVLRRLPQLSREQATAMIRAARQYRDALWIGDTDPNLGWLLLVSAVETCAGFYAVDGVDPVDALREQKPDLCTVLDELGNEGIVTAVAEAMYPTMRATHRFLSFMNAFAPGPRMAPLTF